jgi:para-nitrobenzyl esterase
MAREVVQTANGFLKGTFDQSADIYSFKGIPFAAPPVGDLRWQPPQPVESWSGVRQADHFGPRAMQLPIYHDMNFRSDGMSEDCLYLNVWTAAPSGKPKLPVLVYFYGGGYLGGDGSEFRYDGESMAAKGIVTVTVNYRLGIFGFFAHPELTQESPHHASGNYGLLDQHAALEWVHKNIAAFGGDPRQVTIAGESAGSISVSAQMASPLSKKLFTRAIGESGSILGALSAVPLAQAEARGVRLAAALGKGDALTLADLRKLPANDLLQATAAPGTAWNRPTVDGYFLPVDPVKIFNAGKQMHVPLLAGVNSQESDYPAVLGQELPTVENYRKALQRLYAGQADEIFQLYPAGNEMEVEDAARALASDRFISHSTWKWIDLASKTGSRPSYYYYFDHPRPPEANAPAAAGPPPGSRGAVHSAEIEYALGNLKSNKVYAWTPEDYQISEIMQGYFANFIKTGNPNGPGLLQWPEFATGKRLVIDATPHVERVDTLRARNEVLDQILTRAVKEKL